MLSLRRRPAVDATAAKTAVDQPEETVQIPLLVLASAWKDDEPADLEIVEQIDRPRLWGGQPDAAGISDGGRPGDPDKWAHVVRVPIDSRALWPLSPLMIRSSASDPR